MFLLNKLKRNYRLQKWFRR